MKHSHVWAKALVNCSKSNGYFSPIYYPSIRSSAIK